MNIFYGLLFAVVTIGFGILMGYFLFLNRDNQRKEDEKAEERRLKILAEYQSAIDNFSFLSHYLLMMKKDKLPKCIDREKLQLMAKHVEFLKSQIHKF